MWSCVELVRMVVRESGESEGNDTQHHGKSNRERGYFDGRKGLGTQRKARHEHGSHTRGYSTTGGCPRCDLREPHNQLTPNT